MSKRITCVIKADFLGGYKEFEVEADSHEKAIEGFKKMPLMDVLKELTMGDVVDNFDAKTVELDLSDMTFGFSVPAGDELSQEEEEFMANEMVDNFSTDYDYRNVEVGDYVKLSGEEDAPYLYVLSTRLSTFDVQSEYGVLTDIPYDGIIDLKLESEVFRVVGKP